MPRTMHIEKAAAWNNPASFNLPSVWSAESRWVWQLKHVGRPLWITTLETIWNDSNIKWHLKQHKIGLRLNQHRVIPHQPRISIILGYPLIPSFSRRCIWFYVSVVFNLCTRGQFQRLPHRAITFDGRRLLRASETSFLASRFIIVLRLFVTHFYTSCIVYF
jgi:hypothetical protein